MAKKKAASKAKQSSQKKKAVPKMSLATSIAKVVPMTSVPVQLGKHSAKIYPENASPSDFKRYGPPATRDGDDFDPFGDVKIDIKWISPDSKVGNPFTRGGRRRTPIVTDGLAT